MMTRAYYLPIKILWLISFLLSAIFLSGCASISKGVTAAILEKSESVDTRLCQVWGQPFAGIEPGLAKKQGKTKILMVHGVGDHIPGFTTQFLGKLAKELDLNVRSGVPKNITITTPLFPDMNLGNLRIVRLLNEENGKEVIFYELTWSDITREDKKLLAFDSSGEYDFRRATMNSMLKKFSNDTGPDPLIYLGKSREPIQAAFSQSFCWMVKHNWENIPKSGKHPCLGLNDATDTDVYNMINDDYIFISHSLGSRITIDGMQRIAGMLPNQEKIRSLENVKIGVSEKVIQALRSKRIPIFMLSNQLPMLQLGRELPEVTGQIAQYCAPEGPNYNERMVSETSIIAFSDPNDLLSYGIPPGFSEKYLDSRLCPRITNVNINVAKTIDAFGISGLANPMYAHVGYDTDDRIVALIAKGIGTPNTSPLIKQRCEFTKTVE
ncbi:hypothetical protein [Nitrosospira sp. Nsp13]|uniref:hypothetical protein n=1 Tax=Nitrosospira sp. Nsp13 TaxID=1855332 RepID=UPI00088EC07E|nr:hypothetical protein [Nitrosospira sp. Nsp13]SCY06587.1 hypothetical protein SAMN05216308_103256 [Nitrosospira sp. Nsp13]